MPRKPHNEANLPPLPFEEWDFRTIQGDLLSLRVATQYEYLRSSSLRPAIERWQSQDISVLGRMALRMVVSTLQDLNLVDPRKRFDREIDCPALSDRAEKRYNPKTAPAAFNKEYEKLYKAAEAAMDKQAKRFEKETIAPCTIKQFIERSFRTIKERGKLWWTLEWVKRSLPEEVLQRGAGDIAVCFDAFPATWLTIQSHCWPARRFLFEPVGWDRKDKDDPFRPVRQLRPGKDIVMEEGIPGLVEVRFVINFNCTPEAITSDFTSWLKRHHVGSQPGRRDLDRLLRGLAAYRLTQDRRLTAAQAIALVNARRRTTTAGYWPDLLPAALDAYAWSRLVSATKKALEGDFVRQIEERFARGMANRSLTRLSVS